MVIQRSRNADNNGVRRPQFREVRCSLESPAAQRSRDFGIRDVLDVSATLPEQVYLVLVDVKARGGDALAGKEQGNG